MNKSKFIIHAVIDVNGGIGSVVMNLINFQLKRGYRIGILYSQYYAPFFESLDKSVICYQYEVKKSVGSQMLYGLNINKFYEEIKEKYKNEEIIIHAHNVATIGLFSNIKNIPLICTIHGISRNGIKSIRGLISDCIYKSILLKMQHYNKKICAVSYNTAQYYQKFIPRYKIITVHNGVKINKVANKKNEKFIIGHIGDISYSKGWDTVIEAIALLPKNYKKSIEFRFAGKIVDINENEIRKLIKKYNLEKNAVYLGRVPNAAENVMPDLDVLVLASISEGLPMVILEAQGLGIPVIATDVGGIKEVIEDGYNGFIVEKNPYSIKEKIIELMDNNDKYNSMKDESKKRFELEFSSDIMGKEYEYYYNFI